MQTGQKVWTQITLNQHKNLPHGARFNNMKALGDVTFSDLAILVTDKRSNGIFVFGTEKDNKTRRVNQATGYTFTNG